MCATANMLVQVYLASRLCQSWCMFALNMLRVGAKTHTACLDQGLWCIGPAGCCCCAFQCKYILYTSHVEAKTRTLCLNQVLWCISPAGCRPAALPCASSATLLRCSRAVLSLPSAPAPASVSLMIAIRSCRPAVVAQVR